MVPIRKTWKYTYTPDYPISIPMYRKRQISIFRQNRRKERRVTREKDTLSSSLTFFQLEKKRRHQFFQFLSHTSIWKKFNVGVHRKNFDDEYSHKKLKISTRSTSYKVPRYQYFCLCNNETIYSQLTFLRALFTRASVGRLNYIVDDRGLGWLRVSRTRRT